MREISAKDAAELTKNAAKRIEFEGYAENFWNHLYEAAGQGKWDFHAFRLNERHEEVYRTICEEYGYELKVLGDRPTDKMLFVRWIREA